MADVYARDAAARDLRLLGSLIREVRSGAFKLDESRAGRLDVSKRQKVDDFIGASDLPETAKLFGEVNNASEVLHLEAGLE